MFCCGSKSARLLGKVAALWSSLEPCGAEPEAPQSRLQAHAHDIRVADRPCGKFAFVAGRGSSSIPQNDLPFILLCQKNLLYERCAKQIHMQCC
eukprot:659187-Amphidinium_carterae.1